MQLRARTSSPLVTFTAFAIGGTALAQPSPGIVQSPCPEPNAAAEARRAAIDEAVLAPAPPAEYQRALAAALASGPAETPDPAAALARDWPNLCRYKRANAALKGALGDIRPVAVFMGDSITEGWARGDTELFADTIVGRGIGGQTSPQMLARFWQDVVALRPRVVHIMAGTNDIAGNTGPATFEDFQSNILAMITLARANDIAVVLAAVPPSRQLYWRDNLDPRPLIRTLNAWLRATARELGIEYVDYGAVLADAEGGLPLALSNDGVHPNRDGYARMRPLAQRALIAALEGTTP